MIKSDTLTKPAVESYNSHPSVQKRFKLLMQTPAIRRHMGCEDLQSETSCEL